MSNFTGVTFADQAVSPSDDAIVRRAMLPDGILAGCALTYSGYTLTMGSGYLLACGRQFRHPLAENWAVSDATSGFARLVIEIDLTKTATETTFNQIDTFIEYASAEDGFAELIQTDINISGTKYQMEACKMSLGTGGITGIVSQMELSRADGASLNFKVVGGLTQPSGPSENTIWVPTSAKITAYAVTPAEPAEPVDGMVWIKTGAASNVSFNALKKNEIAVYPNACYQFNNGAWQPMAAKIYQNKTWKEWRTYLYNLGDECVAVTGGWVAKALKRASGTNAKEPTITKLENRIEFSGNAQNGGVVHTANKIDLTSASVLKIDGELVPAAATGFWATLCVWSEFGSTYQDNLAAYHDATSKETGEITIDVSALSGSYYVGFALYGSSSAAMNVGYAE